MRNSWKLKLISAAVWMLATPAAFSSTPFSATELNMIQQHLFYNITTDTHVVVKTDGPYVIHSIPGAVLASRSNKGEHFTQDYQFHWTRDAALVMKEVTELYSKAAADEKKLLKSYLLNYIDFESKAQKQYSRTGNALGQPKYNIDGNLWEGEWGRPQNDGPALRAITFMNIAKVLLAEGEEQFVREKLLDMIIADLNYVAANWEQPTYDLWEELKDKDHFFTKMVERKALREGAAFINQVDKKISTVSYLENAAALTDSLQKHWNPNLGYFSETIDQQFFKGGGLDSSFILGVLHGDLNDANDPIALTNDKVMSSIYFIRNAFAAIYKVNLDNPERPPLIGRYPNDVYDGDQFIYGNPWVITTNALAQYYYSLANQLTMLGEIRITEQNVKFFKQIDVRLANHPEVISLTEDPDRFHFIINALIKEGDKILETVKHYSVCYAANDCLHFAEQIDRASGEPVSAKDLTWNYASLLSAVQSRRAGK